MRKLRRSIAKAYAQEIGIKRLGRRFWGFWRDIQVGKVTGESAQIKAIERVRGKNMRDHQRAVEQNRALARMAALNTIGLGGR